MALLAPLLDALEKHYGPQKPLPPVDPYEFLVWNCSPYLASDAKCAKGWESLKRNVGVEPDRILACGSASLAHALKPGGMFPEKRAMRLKEIADRVIEEFGGDLGAMLRRLPLTKARTVLKNFYGIANPGADRILLFANISPIAAVPSNCTHVPARTFRVGEGKNYNRDYADAQKKIEGEIPASLEARQRAYLLLKRHGRTSANGLPRCAALVLSGDRACSPKPKGDKRPVFPKRRSGTWGPSGRQVFTNACMRRRMSNNDREEPGAP